MAADDFAAPVPPAPPFPPAPGAPPAAVTAPADAASVPPAPQADAFIAGAEQVPLDPALPGASLPPPRPRTVSPTVSALLERCVAADASDLHIHPMSPPVVRVEGVLQPLIQKVWDRETTESVCRALCTEEQWASVVADGTVDFGLPHTGGERFRVSVMRQQQGYAAVLRRIPRDLLSFEEIGLPEATVTDLLQRPRGLILVTGPTGSGKSTSLATMVDWINTNLSRHVVTVEDPVEFRHHNKRGLVTQREVGTDVPSFSEAMRRVLRQDPDVIMLGEMRDLETIQAALTAAETGHLVLGTLHTTGSAKTINRIIDVFPPQQQEQIRVQLALSLLAVISQVLLPEKGSGAGDPGRVAALEVMAMTPAVANLIRNNEINRIQDVIQTSRDRGMFSLDGHLHTLVREGRIDADIALAYCQDPPTLRRLLGLSG
ncbi:MAG: PilT/PilU family type 4a pilus ATPase [Actinobacteria bacterium]|nr:PilT/PilU family type 4a pilus ATPase [Actinomycetota bacterium]